MLDSGRRKNIEEIITKYTLEPSLDKEIYVEGSTDKALIEYFLKKSNIKDITVLEIETVNIDKANVISMNLDDNNRSRLIYLSNLVNIGVVCIIDSDFDFLKTPSYTKPAHLLTTDYTSMELYCFNKETLEKILLGYPSQQPEDYQIFLNILGTILMDLFLIRFAKDNISKSLTYIEFSKQLTINAQNITFAREVYLKKYLRNNSTLIAEFETFIEEKKENLPTDFRKKIHGHDFVFLLQFYLGITQKDAKEAFKKSLYPSLEFENLKHENMFINLITQLSH